MPIPKEILGEYIAQIYLEVKRRPRFLINQKSGFTDEIK